VLFRSHGKRQDAEECVSDTWLAAWNAMPTKRPAKLSAFLGRVVRNLALDRLRGEMRQKRGGGELTLALEELAECLPGPDDPQQELEARDLGRLLNRFVGSLPRAERDVFVARYYFLVPLEELSRRTGFGQSKLKSMLLRTRRKLQKLLKEEGYR
jgi:RNA polymerase sigma-70 factor (ECF subfamily)